MERNAFIEELLRLADKRRVQTEIYARSATSIEAGASGGVLERCESSRSGGLSLRVNVDGCSGYAYTERCEDAQTLLTRAVDNARALKGGDEHPMQGACRYASVERRILPCEGQPNSYQRELALELERQTLKQDPRVKRVVYCDVGVGAGSLLLQNSLGLRAERTSASFYSYVMPVVEANGETQTGFGFRIGEEAADVEVCAREAVQSALGKLGAASVPSGSYRVMLNNLAMTDLLEAFAPMFSAQEAQKGCSLLAGREGRCIGAPCINLIDDPFHAVAPRAFDAEGTPSQTKNVIAGGVLTTLLHNLKTAKKAGVSSTGNAHRASAASPLGAAPSVLYIEKGASDRDTLVTELGDGLIITEFSGLHVGVSPVSGDFSLQARGKLVEKGHIVRAVKDITLAGNFLELLQNVESVADDLRFGMPGGFYAASPSLIVSALTVAGE